MNRRYAGFTWSPDAGTARLRKRAFLLTQLLRRPIGHENRADGQF
ncbi:hypothetical protein P3T23_008892 [Paraburkholderia sp. GAS448]